MPSGVAGRGRWTAYTRYLEDVILGKTSERSRGEPSVIREMVVGYGMLCYPGHELPGGFHANGTGSGTRWRDHDTGKRDGERSYANRRDTVA